MVWKFPVGSAEQWRPAWGGQLGGHLRAKCAGSKDYMEQSLSLALKGEGRRHRFGLVCRGHGDVTVPL